MKTKKQGVFWIGPLVLLMIVLLTSAVHADSEKTIHIRGRERSIVTTANVRLGDIAEISSRRIEDDEAVIGLQKVIVASSPQPGSQTTVSAHKIIERLRQEGVSLQRVGYVLPRVIIVERAARQIGIEEITAAIQDYLQQQQREISIREVRLEEPVHVAPGEIDFDVRAENNRFSGQLRFNLTATVPGENPVSFQAQARYDEWRIVPVAKRHVSRGSLISDQDVMLARMNVSALPRDAALEVDQIIGQEVSGDIALGEAFRSNRLAVPVVVNAGSQVLLLYQAPLFEATATGVALESGVQDQEIRVRNLGSKKIVSGRVAEAGLVLVGQ